MTNPIFYYHLKDVEKNKSIKYVLSIGKRQPMHIGHKRSLERIISLKHKTLIYVIGSVNKYGDPLFDPFTNPLNLEQQIEQFKRVFPRTKAIFIPIVDTQELADWGPLIIKDLIKFGIKPNECVIHFIGKEEDKIEAPCSFIHKDTGKTVTLDKGHWLIEVLSYYGIPIWFDNEFPVDLKISARSFRDIDLRFKEETSFLAAPEYLLEIASAAKDKTDGKVTLKDLSLSRIRHKQ